MTDLITFRRWFAEDLRLRAPVVRNLSLIERRMTPDLYTLVTAAQQIAGDQFAICLAETTREYPFVPELPFPTLTAAIGRGRLADGEIVEMKSRLPGPHVGSLAWLQRVHRLLDRLPRLRQGAWVRVVAGRGVGSAAVHVGVCAQPRRSGEKASSKHRVETGNRGVSRPHHRRPIGLPLNPGERGKFSRQPSREPYAGRLGHA